ncbi:MAG: M23 family peptidase, partial [Mesorhizobium sp.]
VSINAALKAIESQQLTRIATLADNAYRNADAISQALEAAGLPVDGDFGESDAGGPLIPLDGSMTFDSKVRELDEALDTLDRVKTKARRLPLANPAPGRSVT